MRLLISTQAICSALKLITNFLVVFLNSCIWLYILYTTLMIFNFFSVRPIFTHVNGQCSCKWPQLWTVNCAMLCCIMCSAVNSCLLFDSRLKQSLVTWIWLQLKSAQLMPSRPVSKCRQLMASKTCLIPHLFQMTHRRQLPAPVAHLITGGRGDEQSKTATSPVPALQQEVDSPDEFSTFIYTVRQKTRH